MIEPLTFIKHVSNFTSVFLSNVHTFKLMQYNIFCNKLSHPDVYITLFRIHFNHEVDKWKMQDEWRVFHTMTPFYFSTENSDSWNRRYYNIIQLHNSTCTFMHVCVNKSMSFLFLEKKIRGNILSIVKNLCMSLFRVEWDLIRAGLDGSWLVVAWGLIGGCLGFDGGWLAVEW